MLLSGLLTEAYKIIAGKENMKCEKSVKERHSDAVKSSTIVQVAVTECLPVESVLMVIIAEKSIH